MHDECIRCGLNRRIYAKGKCRPCYQAVWVRTANYKPVKHWGPCTKCGEVKQIAARGMCWTCYRKVLEAERD